MDDGKGDLIWAIVRSILAVVFFYAFRGIGLIFAIYAVIYAFRAHGKGHRFGVAGIVISCFALVVVIIGWVLRFNGTRV